MPGTMITETFRKRRASDIDEESAVVTKKSKSAPDAPSAPASFSALDFPLESPDSATKSTAAAERAAQPIIDFKSVGAYTWRRKENRSPNLTLLDQLSAELDNYEEAHQGVDQIAQVEEGPAPTQSSEGLLNLLLLADSSLQYPSNDQNEQLEADGDQEAQGNKEHNDDSTTDDSEQSANDSEQDDDSGNETCSEGKDLDDQSAPSTSDDAARQRPTSAGLRPRITAQAASMMSVTIDMDSDSSSDEEEEEPTPVRKHKGMGRYGQDLHNTASLALRQTNLLKKKCANRTTKTARQLRNAKEHSCGAAQRAVEATKAAEKAVQNLAHFADAFDDLVKEAIRAANEAAQSRADYAASVVAADMAEARRDRVISKRGKRRSASPKTPKRMSCPGLLVQERVFSKVDPPSAASVAYSAAAVTGDKTNGGDC